MIKAVSLFDLTFVFFFRNALPSHPCSSSFSTVFYSFINTLHSTMSYSAGVDLDWCLTCNQHLVRALFIHSTLHFSLPHNLFFSFPFQNVPNTSYCSPQCEQTPSKPLFNLSSNANEWTHSEDGEDDAVIYHVVHDTSSPKGIAAWAANIPTGAPPNDLLPFPSHSSSQPKLLRPQCVRLAPPALSMSESTSASIPLATPDITMLSSLANHIRSFVSSSSMGFPITKLPLKSKPHLPNSIAHLQRRESSFSSDSFEEDDDHDHDHDHDLSPSLSPFEETEDFWWVTDSDSSSSAVSSVVPKKSEAQLIAPSERQKHRVDCEMFFQPKVLPIPIELSSKMQVAGLQDEEIFEPRGRQVCQVW
ncbi:hypothetical protein F5050DRAFT_240516 [Lentinula boryana]|uniref:Uncharacterized protein n=1 Tax=Lentinula boryana TaxID=40481 RepID=A0ABQ8QRA6_9AGAR|nr:hypothetical protein F5050DRAFT_240516 [Lentinula boryana]